MRRRTFIFTPQSDDNGIAESQTPSGAGSLTLNGALVSSGVATLQPSGSEGGAIVDIECAADESGRTFTITGTDVHGRTLTEDVTGANAGTASSTAYFATVTDISVDDATAGAVYAGVTGKAACPVYVPNFNSTKDFEASLDVTIGGTASVTVKHSLDDPWDGTAFHSYDWENHDSLAAISASDDGNYAFPPTMIQATTDSWSSGAVKFKINVPG